MAATEHKNIKMKELERHNVLDQTEALYKAMPVALWATIGVSLLNLVVLWASVDHTALFSWFAVMLILVIIRGINFIRYSKADITAASCKVWLNEALFWTFILGLLWGSIAILFISPNDMPRNFYIIIIGLGYLATSVVTLGVYFPAIRRLLAFRVILIYS